MNPVNIIASHSFAIPNSTSIMAEKTNKQKVLVVGAGPVGALAALYAANRGDDVHVYELRAGM